MEFGVAMAMSEEHKRAIAEGQERRRQRLAQEARSGDLIGDEEPTLPDDGEPEVPPVVEPATQELDELRQRLFAGMDESIVASFTDAEIAAIIARANEEALAEKKKQALETVKQRAKTRARVEQGLVPADVLRSADEQARLDELVNWRCNLPSGGGLGLRIDGRMFEHGGSYTTTRAVAASAFSMMYQSWLTEIRFKGLKPVDQMRDFRSPEIGLDMVH